MSPNWAFVADTVMGGVSDGQVISVEDGARQASRLTGTVRTENNGGFIQMAFNPSGQGAFDARAFQTVSFEAKGNGEIYEVGLRTTDLTRPWQSYRAQFEAGPAWQRVEIPFDAFTPNRAPVPLDRAKLRRIGILAVGRAFEADVAIADFKFCA